ncbi:sulfurtransferase TusA family protein [Acidianus sp. HS-5]|uniref:sulfurtransferase TusA family protein n=1 Tax=Acidianus sp. HS-5 TaxID=2886040 RepID=UPI001F1BCD09|nr:sulfurtransferase TusA family protein [Acidianus sp. HS-5]BDC19712.1 hypothetical protein HS5_26020 [Acidianus sp. HS-5]
MQQLDLRNKSCEEFIVELSKYLVSMKPGETITLLTEKDRVLCLHQLLRNAPRYLFNYEEKEDHVVINIKRLR